MKKLATVTLFLISGCPVFAQTRSQLSPSRAAVTRAPVSIGNTNSSNNTNYSAKPLKQAFPGSIIIPQLQSVQVVYSDNQQVALHLNDLMAGKTISNFCKLVVNSNVPWRVSVSAGDKLIESESQSNSIPVELINVKTSNSAKYIHLSDKPQIILSSDNDLLTNTYTIDVKIDPTSSAPGDNYPLTLFFTISSQ